MWNRRTYESLKSEIKIEKIDLYQRANMKIDKIASSAKCRIDEQFQNCQFFSQILILQIDKNLEFLLILKKIPIRKGPKMFNSKIFKNFQFGKLEKLIGRTIPKLLIFRA